MPATSSETLEEPGVPVPVASTKGKRPMKEYDFITPEGKVIPIVDEDGEPSEPSQSSSDQYIDLGDKKKKRKRRKKRKASADADDDELDILIAGHPGASYVPRRPEDIPGGSGEAMMGIDPVMEAEIKLLYGEDVPAYMVRELLRQSKGNFSALHEYKQLKNGYITHMKGAYDPSIQAKLDALNDKGNQVKSSLRKLLPDEGYDNDFKSEEDFVSWLKITYGTVTQQEREKYSGTIKALRNEEELLRKLNDRYQNEQKETGDDMYDGLIKDTKDKIDDVRRQLAAKIKESMAHDAASSDSFKAALWKYRNRKRIKENVEGYIDKVDRLQNAGIDDLAAKLLSLEEQQSEEFQDFLDSQSTAPSEPSVTNPVQQMGKQTGVTVSKFLAELGDKLGVNVEGSPKLAAGLSTLLKSYAPDGPNYSEDADAMMEKLVRDIMDLFEESAMDLTADTDGDQIPQASQEQVQHYIDRINELREELDKSKRMHAADNEKGSSIVAQFDLLLQQKDNDLVKLMEENDKTKKEIEELNAKFAEHRRKNAELSPEDLDQLKNRIRMLEDLHESNQRIQSEQAQDIHKLREEREHQRALAWRQVQADAFLHEVEDFINKTSQGLMYELPEGMDDPADPYPGAIGTALRNLHRTSHEIIRLGTMVGDSQRRIEVLEASVETWRQANEQLRILLAQRESEIGDLQTTVDGLRQDGEDFMNDNNEYLVHTLEHKLDESTKTIFKHELEIRRLNDQIRKIQESGAIQDNETINVVNALERTRREAVQKLADEKERAKRELEEVRRNYDNKLDELEHDKSEAEREAKVRLEKLRKTLNESLTGMQTVVDSFVESSRLVYTGHNSQAPVNVTNITPATLEAFRNNTTLHNTILSGVQNNGLNIDDPRLVAALRYISTDRYNRARGSTEFENRMFLDIIRNFRRLDPRQNYLHRDLQVYLENLADLDQEYDSDVNQFITQEYTVSDSVRDYFITMANYAMLNDAYRNPDIFVQDSDLYTRAASIVGDQAPYLFGTSAALSAARQAFEAIRMQGTTLNDDTRMNLILKAMELFNGYYADWSGSAPITSLQDPTLFFGRYPGSMYNNLLAQLLDEYGREGNFYTQRQIPDAVMLMIHTTGANFDRVWSYFLKDFYRGHTGLTYRMLPNNEDPFPYEHGNSIMNSYSQMIANMRLNHGVRDMQGDEISIAESESTYYPETEMQSVGSLGATTVRQGPPSVSSAGGTTVRQGPRSVTSGGATTVRQTTLSTAPTHYQDNDSEMTDLIINPRTGTVINPRVTFGGTEVIQLSDDDMSDDVISISSGSSVSSGATTVRQGRRY